MAKEDNLKEEREKEQIEKLTPEEKFCLTAYYFSEGKSKDNLIMAYKLSRKKEQSENVNPANFYQIAYRWNQRERNQLFLNRLKCKYSLIKQDVNESEENEPNGVLSNDEILKKLSDEIKKAEREKKTDIVMKGLIALSETKRKQGQKEDERKIHFFIPKKCHSCAFKKFFVQQNKRNNLKNKDL